MHILIAPNAFKNSLDASSASKAIEEGLKECELSFTSECFPIADGGDGTAELIINKCKGETIYVEVQDPLGRKIRSSFGLIENGKTMIIEMANASGLRLLKEHELNPLIASSFGTGELIIHALNKNVSKIIIAMGGSATVDGGIGILMALGVRFLNEQNEVLNRIKEFTHLDHIDLSGIDKRIFDCQVIVLCDVDNKLLGDRGAAKVFGPQKGASPEGVIELEDILNKIAEVALKQTRIDLSTLKYGGTAGGAAAGLYCFINAQLVNGIGYFLELTGFKNALSHSDVVITGEGSIDHQTLEGKGPFGVAKLAKENGCRVIGLAGKIPAQPNEELSKYFDELISINKESEDLKESMRNTYLNLKDAAKELGKRL